MKNTSTFGNGNGLSLLFGFTYLLPLSLIYAQPVRFTLTIMCFSWIYTIFIFSLSVRLGALVKEQYFDATVLFFNTALFIITLPRFIRFLNNKFISIIQNIDKKMLTLLLQIGVIWFITAVLVNYYFVSGGAAVVKLIITILLVSSALLTIKLFYSLVVISETASTLFTRIKTDPLTKLRNRTGFIEDGEQKIGENRPFSLVFIDFDNFKSFNDNMVTGLETSI